MIPIYCINRKKDEERKLFMIDQLKGFDCDLIFLEACEGANLSPHDKLNLGYQKKQREKWFKPLHSNEIGCFVSHRKCLDLIISSGDDYAVVLEDDVILDDDFCDKIESICSEVKDWDLVKLETREELPKGKIIGECSAGQIFATLSASKGTIGLLYSKNGAQKIRYTMNSFIFPIDNHLGYLWRHKITIIGIFPSLVRFDADIKSGIPERGSTIFLKGIFTFIAKQLFKLNNSYNKRRWAKQVMKNIKTYAE